MVDLIEDGPKIVGGLIVYGLLRKKAKRERADIPEGVLAEYQVQVQREKGDPWDRHSGFATWDDAEAVRISLIPAVQQGALGGARVERVIL